MITWSYSFRERAIRSRMTLDPSNSAGCGGIGPAGKIDKFGTCRRNDYLLRIVGPAYEGAESSSGSKPKL